MNAKVLDEAWKRQRLWSALADAKAAAIATWRRVNLLLVFVGAVCGALAAQGWLPATAGKVVGAGGAAALAGAALVQSRMLGADRLRARLTARAASESLKSAVFQYLARVPPYDGADPAAALDSVLGQVAEQGKDLAGEMRLATPRRRDLPAVAGIADYVQLRADDQRRYHTDGLRRHQLLERRWRVFEVTATVLAASLSAVGSAVAGTNLSAWVGVATTLAAAFGAHLAGAQHARLAASYALTVDELERLLAGFDAATATDATAGEFVAKVEAVLARQNESWVSSLSPQR